MTFLGGLSVSWLDIVKDLSGENKGQWQAMLFFRAHGEAVAKRKIIA